MPIQISKTFYRRAVGAFLLTLPLGGATMALVSVQAQPALPTKNTANNLPPDKKAEIKRVLGLSQQSGVCKRLIDLKVENANFADVVERIKQILPANTLEVEVRAANPVSVSLDLKQAKVGDILSNVAALAGCKLFVHDAQLIITPPAELSQAELADFKQRNGGEWIQSRDAGGAEWGNNITGNLVLLGVIAQEAVGADTGAVKTTFGKFSPESQQIILALVAAHNERLGNIPPPPGRPPFSPLHMAASSPINVDAKGPESISVMFPPDLSHPGGLTTGISVTTVHADANRPPAKAFGSPPPANTVRPNRSIIH